MRLFLLGVIAELLLTAVASGQPPQAPIPPQAPPARAETPLYQWWHYPDGRSVLLPLGQVPPGVITRPFGPGPVTTPATPALRVATAATRPMWSPVRVLSPAGTPMRVPGAGLGGSINCGPGG
jgi:hypothetical protein